MIGRSTESFFIVSAGGSVSNMYGMVLARYKAVPDSKTKGLSGLPPLVVFTSEDVSHGHRLSGRSLPLFSSSFFFFFMVILSNFQFLSTLHIFGTNCMV
jgi:hypothetical protein